MKAGRTFVLIFALVAVDAADAALFPGAAYQGAAVGLITS